MSETILDDKVVEDLTDKIVATVIEYMKESGAEVKISEVVTANFLASSKLAQIIIEIQQPNPLVS